jgi:type III secretion system FlhB-like substrate exporter
MRGYNHTHETDKYDKINDMEGYAKDLIDQCEEASVAINKDPKQLKHAVSTDLRDNIPPQLYFVVSGLIDVIQQVEEEA